MGACGFCTWRGREAEKSSCVDGTEEGLLWGLLLAPADASSDWPLELVLSWWAWRILWWPEPSLESEKLFLPWSVGEHRGTVCVASALGQTFPRWWWNPASEPGAWWWGCYVLGHQRTGLLKAGRPGIRRRKLPFFWGAPPPLSLSGWRLWELWRVRTAGSWICTFGRRCRNPSISCLKDLWQCAGRRPSSPGWLPTSFSWALGVPLLGIPS